MVATSQNTLEGIYEAAKRLEGIADLTPLQLNANLSEQYQCNIFLKREDLQVVRSYKIRGAYNKMSSLPKEILDQGVVCASAGNHAQGFAFACQRFVYSQIKNRLWFVINQTFDFCKKKMVLKQILLARFQLERKRHCSAQAMVACLTAMLLS